MTQPPSLQALKHGARATPRLNRRAALLAEWLGQKPGTSIPGRCENWAETPAAYRFLRNEQASCENTTQLDYKRLGDGGPGAAELLKPSADCACVRPAWSLPSASGWG